jgi:hypothetical protein
MMQNIYKQEKKEYCKTSKQKYKIVKSIKVYVCLQNNLYVTSPIPQTKNKKNKGTLK